MTLNDPNPGFKGNPFSGGEKHSLGRRSCAALSPWVVDNGFIYLQNTSSWNFSLDYYIMETDSICIKYVQNRIQSYCIFRISQKRCILRTKLLWNTNRKPYTAYQMIPLSMTLSDLWSGFQGRDIYRHWISQKRHEVET